MEYHSLTLTQLRTALRRGETTSVAATQAMLDRIVAVDNDIKSYLVVSDEMALEQAAAADARRAEGQDLCAPWQLGGKERSHAGPGS